MTTFISKDIQSALDEERIRRARKSTGITVRASGEHYPVLRFWKTGFALESGIAPRLRGLVDLYEGDIHLCQCLVVASEEIDRECRFEFKRMTAVSDRPAADFERPANAPVALIASIR